jgi:trigger factor
MADEEKTKSKNIVTIEDSGPCKKKVSIEVPAEVIKETLDEQYNELRRDAEVPGFRKGRAPLRLLEKKYGSDIKKQVKLKLLAGACEEITEDEKLDTLGEPDFDHEKIEMPDDGAMKFDFEVEVRPDFELPSLEGIAVEKPKAEITDEQVDEELLSMRKRAGLWSPKETGTVERGEQIIADAILKIDGQEEHEKLDNTEIFVRANGFVGPVPVEGLDTLLDGCKIGDVKTTNIEVPKTFYNEQYRDKKIEVEIEVKEIKQLEPAELDKEFFGRHGVDDEKGLREMIRDSYAEYSQRQAKKAMGDQIYQYLLKETTFDLPDDVVADQSSRLLQRQYTNMLMQGVGKEQVDEQMDQLRASSQQQAEEQLKLLFVMERIADKFEIKVSEEEINGYIAQAAASRGRRPEKMRAELIKDGSLAQFGMQIREQKCIEKLLESAKITDIDPAKAVKKTPAKTAAKKTAKKKTAKKAEKAKETTRKDTSAKRAKKSVASAKKTVAKKADKKAK